MLRVCGAASTMSGDATSTPGPASFFSVDSRKKQVTLFDPAACGGSAAPEDRRVGVAAPKMFAFDAIFTQDDSQMEIIGTEEFECNGFIFISGFDSSNLAGVDCVYKKEYVPNGYYLPLKGPLEEIPDYEFNIWSRRDCEGTSYECAYKMWFYFGVRTELAQGNLVQFNLMGAQAKVYSEGMSPVYLVIPGSQEWQRIKKKVSYFAGEDYHGISFRYRMPAKGRSTTYFAFTYPFPFEQLQSYLFVAEKHLLRHKDIYFHRECVCHTLEGRPIELITVSSYRNMTRTREPRLKNLFPLKDKPRAFIFKNKKVVFISARVHPGETPSSFVLKGFMDYLLTSFDPLGANLRNNFVFKIIPMLNPDGVAKGNFRTDSRGMDLNRVYNEPSLYHHPSIYAARALILYYHFGKEVEDSPTTLEETVMKTADLQTPPPSASLSTEKVASPEESTNSENPAKRQSVVSIKSSSEKSETSLQRNRQERGDLDCKSTHSNLARPSVSSLYKEKYAAKVKVVSTGSRNDRLRSQSATKIANKATEVVPAQAGSRSKDSGLFMYVDLHGHSSKKGVFMFGNYFKDPEDLVECMLFPKIMSLNSENFDFSACSFSEKNMSLKDKSGELSKDGCGRVVALKMTGVIRCYTLECNYNTGRVVNELPPRAVVDSKPDIHTIKRKTPQLPSLYTPDTFEDVGKALAVSLLDLKGCNPWSRVPYSEYHTIDGIRRWLKMQCLPEQEAINKRNAKLAKLSH